MKSIKKEYQTRKPTEEDFAYAWIDMFKIINDSYDEDVYTLWGIAINAPDQLDNFRKMEAFTFMESVILCSLISLNLYHSYKPNSFEIVRERYYRKLSDTVELHFLDTTVPHEDYIDNRFKFYYQELEKHKYGELPEKIYSAFYDMDFYFDPKDIPSSTDITTLKEFNKYLLKMLNETNTECLNFFK